MHSGWRGLPSRPHASRGAFRPYPITPPPFPAGRSERLGDQPNPAILPPLPTFTPTGGLLLSPGLDALGADGSEQQPKGIPNSDPQGSLHSSGPYNPASSLPPKMVKKILSLEFVEMSELRGDIWPDDSTTDTPVTSRCTAKPPVISIKTWLECYARMAAVLVSRFPEKAPELWAYQSTILRAAHDFEGANWVAYDRQFRREMLAGKCLDWSIPNTRLYNEAFTGRARSIPRCPHCLADDHVGVSCPHNPNPPILGWFQGSAPIQIAPASQLQSTPPKPGAPQEVCRSFNVNRCQSSRCRYSHVCSDCGGAHAALNCPHKQSTSTGRGPSPRSRFPPRARQQHPHPYLLPPNGTGLPEQL